MKLARTIFWASAAGIVHTHVTYPAALALLSRLRGPAQPPPPAGNEEDLPRVSLVIPAFDEEGVIAAKVENALALDYPRELLEVVVASDGSSDSTVERARAAGADLVLDLPRGGKMATQDAAVERCSGEIVAFSDANSTWDPDALRLLAAAFGDPAVAYACGQVAYLDPEGGNEEGAYWRLETWIRRMESDLAGVTAGNGGIYAIRRSDHIPLPPSRSHDLSLPFLLAKRGRRSVYVAEARAEEPMVPTLEGEFARKRRMMVGIPDIVIGDRMWDPRGYSPLFAFEVFSHRVLRYASPLLHALALLANLPLLGRGRIYRLAFAAQLALIGGALAGGPEGPRPARLARYYVLVTASIALGCWDRWRDGPPAAWEKAEGTR
jgi:cellulose synthase/poly-beta-1,6-N-acetylglucosamine synthase-like glycosyltransferase